jgi:hypothetical protein
VVIKSVRYVRVKPKNWVECKCTSRIAPTGPDWLMYLNEREIAKARIERQAGEFRCSGRVTGYPEVIPKKCGSVRIGDDPTGI